MSSASLKPYYDDQGNLVIPHELFDELLTSDYPDTGMLMLSLYRLLLSANDSGTENSQISNLIKRVLGVLDARGISLDPNLDQQMLGLAHSSMEFWDNPIDDEVWNNA